MFDIDKIMEMLDWNNSIEDQALAIESAKNVKCINVFLQPGSPYGKRVWDNCAKILSARSDKELAPYLIPLLEWMQDLNWPGALTILDRMISYTDMSAFNFALNRCIARATALQDETWLANLYELRDARISR